jgi:hypothetical protein
MGKQIVTFSPHGGKLNQDFLQPHYHFEEESDDMKSWKHTLHLWWRKRTLEGGYIALTKNNTWGVTAETLSFLHDSIQPLLSKNQGLLPLRHVTGALHTETIDELISDLFIVKRSLETRAYVDERLVYLQPKPRSFHTYLALSSGRAITAHEAWETFHPMALSTAQLLDALKEDQSEKDADDLRYYGIRYQSVFDETFEVYRLFARLVGLDCPPLNRSNGAA